MSQYAATKVIVGKLNKNNGWLTLTEISPLAESHQLVPVFTNILFIQTKAWQKMINKIINKAK
jgi:hypothetical protein